MVNVTPAKYTVQIGPTMTPEAAGELAAWARMRGVSVSVVARECVEAGLSTLRESFKAQAVDTRQYTERKWEALLRKEIAEAQARGDRQVARRKAYDDKTRGKSGGEEGGAADTGAAA